MSLNTTILVLLVIACQQCLAQFQPTTIDNLNRIQNRLKDRETGPLIALAINNAQEIVSDPEASGALIQDLDETLKITQNNRLVLQLDYLFESIAQTLQDNNLRQLLLQRLTLTNEIFHKDTTKAFLSRALQVTYRLMTDRDLLRAIRQIFKASAYILTDPSAQRLISGLLFKAYTILEDPQAMYQIHRSLKLLDHVISNEEARVAIKKVVIMMKSGLRLLGPFQAKHLGIFQARLAEFLNKFNKQ